jgi:cytochrome c-type biogenesis protein
MSLFFAFVAGLVTVLSPCVLPLLPVILASSTLEGKWRPFGVIIGFVLCFTTVTLALSILVQQFSISPNAHRTAAASIFILMGLVLAVPFLKEQFELLAARATNKLTRQTKQGEGLVGGLVAGAGLGLAWTPCVGPIMAAVITLAMNQETTLNSALVAISFSLGTALPMGAAVLLGGKLYRRIAFLKSNSSNIQRAMGLLILAVGLAIWLGFDRQIQILLFRLFPGWESTLTGWEGFIVD